MTLGLGLGLAPPPSSIREWAHQILVDLDVAYICLGETVDGVEKVRHTDACTALCKRLGMFGEWALNNAANAPMEPEDRRNADKRLAWFERAFATHVSNMPPVGTSLLGYRLRLQFMDYADGPRWRVWERG